MYRSIPGLLENGRRPQHYYYYALVVDFYGTRNLVNMVAIFIVKMLFYCFRLRMNKRGQRKTK